MYILFSISSGLEFLSLTHTSIYENYESKVFKNAFLLVKYLKIYQRIYYEEMYTRLLNLVVNHFLQYCNGLMVLQKFLNEVHVHHFYVNYLTFSTSK